LVTDPPTADQSHLIAAAAPHIQSRISTLAQAPGMLAFLFAGGGFTVDPQDAEKVLTPDAAKTLQAADTALASLEPWDASTIEEALRAAVIDGLGLKPKVAFAPLYVAVTGRRVSLPLFQSIELLGRDRTLARLAQAIARLPG
jgi:glutamyl-tRNA synthetase